MGWIVPSPTLAKLVLTVNTGVEPNGRNSPVVLYLCHSALYKWEYTEGEALAELALLLTI